jgi:protein transport protein SEC24
VPSLPRTSPPPPAYPSTSPSIRISQAGRGGHVLLFQSTLPTVGPGTPRPSPFSPASSSTPPARTTAAEAELYDTDKEKTLFGPRDAFWGAVGEACAEEGIGVSAFLGASQHADVASLSQRFLFSSIRARRRG